MLLAVFVTNTVYAAGVMTSKPFEQLQTDQLQATQSHRNAAIHHQDHTQNVANCDHYDESIDTNVDVHSRCNQCHHCFVCFSVLPQLPLNIAIIKPTIVLAVLFKSIYLSPIAIQPQKPPIV